MTKMGKTTNADHLPDSAKWIEHDPDWQDPRQAGTAGNPKLWGRLRDGFAAFSDDDLPDDEPHFRHDR